VCPPPELFALKKVAIAKHNAVLKAEKEAEIRRQQEEDLLLLNAMLDKERKAEEGMEGGGWIRRRRGMRCVRVCCVASCVGMWQVPRIGRPHEPRLRRNVRRLRGEGG
jgi:hypothetical protein